MCGSEALAWELRGRGGREWRHMEERRREREREGETERERERE